jgi:hypothetical protein
LLFLLCEDLDGREELSVAEYLGPFGLRPLTEAKDAIGRRGLQSKNQNSPDFSVA